MMTDPERLWTAAELRVLCPGGNPASYLHFALKKGYVQRVPTPSSSTPAGVSWKFVCLPIQAEEASGDLNPPTNSPWGTALRLGEANPDAWFGIRELRHFFSNQSGTELRTLIEAG